MDKNECKVQTYEHQKEVRNLMCAVAHILIERAHTHDDTKLRSPELEAFTEVNSGLAGLTYGSEEYQECLKKLGVSLAHHYKYNRHHPEHFEDGVRCMHFVDVVEMFCDWMAAATRHDDGDIMESIEHNRARFCLDDLVLTEETARTICEWYAASLEAEKIIAYMDNLLPAPEHVSDIFAYIRIQYPNLCIEYKDVLPWDAFTEYTDSKPGILTLIFRNTVKFFRGEL